MGKEKKVKPKFLYHGSPHKHLSKINPKEETKRVGDEDVTLFATPDINFASVFITTWDDSWCRFINFDGTYIFVCKDEERFMSSDKGGSIYTLDSTPFITDNELSPDGLEWTTKEVVAPVHEEVYESGFASMIQHGIKIHFVSKAVFEGICNSNDLGKKIIETL